MSCAPAMQGAGIELNNPICVDAAHRNSARYQTQFHAPAWRCDAQYVRDLTVSFHTLISPQYSCGHLPLGFHRSVYTSTTRFGVDKESRAPAEGAQGPDHHTLEAAERLENTFADLGQYEGLPPLLEILNEDEDAEERAARRDAEIQKQVEIEKTRVRKVDEDGRAYGLGRRKCSTARVHIWENEGAASPTFMVNDRLYTEYFPLFEQISQMLHPFMVTGTTGRFNIEAKVHGGGMSSQAGAIVLGVARALQNFEPSWRKLMKSEGLMTRDQRMVERKKPGKPKARKSFQWVKR
eukprot:CAMPEP_0198209508 /NCGR_PEP_ID=MMETSP1445-20131203/16529_1 /TAXON_ID=36898 /ORGANISM="Pyramimonas sp., Strain CCMP2087" /LENGTH=293 /DNA_ID=CAMNT_0043883309 /DNA_START=179 /DNA_END=1060 /DNA_ORIENTATION=+